jgi:uncharacterized protein YndB with AHSA1/START domain
VTLKPIKHGSFAIERVYSASPERVFGAWTDPEIKSRWFIGPETWSPIKREIDARVGGQEILHGRFESGKETIFKARYHDVVNDARLVFVYDMHVSGAYLSTSLATVEITPRGSKTKLVFTEQAAFFDGEDGTASREFGTAAHLDRLGALLSAPHEPSRSK